MDFQTELQQLLNKHSKENGSNTPDFILAAYLCNCLFAFNEAQEGRVKFYARQAEEADTISVPSEFSVGDIVTFRKGTHKYEVIEIAGGSMKLKDLVNSQEVCAPFYDLKLEIRPTPHLPFDQSKIAI